MGSGKGQNKRVNSITLTENKTHNALSEVRKCLVEKKDEISKDDKENNDRLAYSIEEIENILLFLDSVCALPEEISKIFLDNLDKKTSLLISNPMDFSNKVLNDNKTAWDFFYAYAIFGHPNFKQVFSTAANIDKQLIEIFTLKTAALKKKMLNDNIIQNKNTLIFPADLTEYREKIDPLTKYGFAFSDFNLIVIDVRIFKDEVADHIITHELIHSNEKSIAKGRMPTKEQLTFSDKTIKYDAYNYLREGIVDLATRIYMGSNKIENELITKYDANVSFVKDNVLSLLRKSNNKDNDLKLLLDVLRDKTATMTSFLENNPNIIDELNKKVD